MPLPEDDRTLKSRAQYEDDLAGLLGGRVAEELIFTEPSTGATNDLERVTKLAKAMVTRFGMSEKMGPMMFGQKEEMIFLGREISEQRDYSEAVAQEIDGEVRGVVNWAYDRARTLLKENRDKLDLVANRLLEVETIEQEEFLALMGVTPMRPTPSGTQNEPATPKARPKSEENADHPSLGTAPSPA